MNEQELGTLVDPDTIRKSIKRIFTNTGNEIMGELLQNSQRACASRVDVITNDNGFLYQDNGNGLENGLESFHTLLAMAKSYFNNSTIEDQDPMGLGIHALIAHDSVQSVRFSSGSLSLLIDTEQWWSSPSYYKSWHERVDFIPPVAGFKIDVVCKDRLLEDVKNVMNSTWKPVYGTRFISAACGYAGILDIYFNEKQLNTEVPYWCRPSKTLCLGQYEGCEVILGTTTATTSPTSSVIWYGQVIEVPMTLFEKVGDLRFQIKVTSGHPFNPMSPSRRGMVIDEKMHKFVQWCKEEVFRQYHANSAFAESVEYITGLFHIDRVRASSDLPVYLASKLMRLEETDYSSYELGMKHSYHVFRYEDREANVISDDLFVMESLVGGKETIIPYGSGLASLLQETNEEYYTMVLGDQKRMTSKKLVWKPGAPLTFENKECQSWASSPFFLPGEWCIQKDGEMGEWHSVSEDATVFAFSDRDSYSAIECEWIVGTCRVSDFFSNIVDYGFDSEGDGGYDEMHSAYEESVSEWRREIAGGAFKYNFTLTEAESVFSYPERLVKIELEYSGPERYRNASHIVFISNQGNAVRRVLMD